MKNQINNGKISLFVLQFLNHHNVTGQSDVPTFFSGTAQIYQKILIS